MVELHFLVQSFPFAVSVEQFKSSTATEYFFGLEIYCFQNSNWHCLDFKMFIFAFDPKEFDQKLTFHLLSRIT